MTSEPLLPADDPGQLRKLREEEAKLTATWVNNVAVGTFAIGVLQPAVGSGVTPWAFLFIVAAVVLHVFARLILRRLFPKE